jgi:hypothetical protein
MRDFADIPHTKRLALFESQGGMYSIAWTYVMYAGDGVSIFNDEMAVVIGKEKIKGRAYLAGTGSGGPNAIPHYYVVVS